MKFIAFQDKHSSTLILQDGSAFIGAAKRHIDPIEVENNEITANLDDTDATKGLREALEVRRKKAKPVMPDFLSDHPLQ